jgi:hypothetical protein
MMEREVGGRFADYFAIKLTRNAVSAIVATLCFQFAQPADIWFQRETIGILLRPANDWFFVSAPPFNSSSRCQFMVLVTCARGISIPKSTFASM